MDNKLYVVVTYSNENSVLVEIADALLQLDVPAVHISSVESRYRWKGRHYFDNENKLDALCDEGLLGSVVNTIKALHNYELPAIIWYEVEADSDTYNWAVSQNCV